MAYMGGGVDAPERGELLCGRADLFSSILVIEFGPSKPVAVTALASSLPSCLRES